MKEMQQLRSDRGKKDLESVDNRPGELRIDGMIKPERETRH